MDLVEHARFLATLQGVGITPALVPCKSGTKIPAVSWAHMSAGEQIPDLPGTTARAILTGSRSGGLVVLDVDSAAGGFETLERLESEWGVLPSTLQVRSPTGGLHIYLRASSAIKTQAGQLGPGVDIRGEGGIVLTPGSQHPKGGHYRIEEP